MYWNIDTNRLRLRMMHNFCSYLFQELFLDASLIEPNNIYSYCHYFVKNVVKGQARRRTKDAAAASSALG